jgi:hypothetical protein
MRGSCEGILLPRLQDAWAMVPRSGIYESLFRMNDHTILKVTILARTRTQDGAYLSSGNTAYLSGKESFGRQRRQSAWFPVWEQEGEGHHEWKNQFYNLYQS